MWVGGSSWSRCASGPGLSLLVHVRLHQRLCVWTRAAPGTSPVERTRRQRRSGRRGIRVDVPDTSLVGRRCNPLTSLAHVAATTLVRVLPTIAVRMCVVFSEEASCLRVFFYLDNFFILCILPTIIFKLSCSIISISIYS